MGEPMADMRPASDPNGSLRRAIVAIVSGLIILLNAKLGFDLSSTDIAAFAGIVSAYLIQSGVKAGLVKKE